MQLDVKVSPAANSKGSSSPFKQNVFPSQMFILQDIIPPKHEM